MPSNHRVARMRFTVREEGPAQPGPALRGERIEAAGQPADRHRCFPPLPGLDRREFAICAGWVGLTTADASMRHHRTSQAAAPAPGA